MKKYTQKAIRRMVTEGKAISLDTLRSRADIGENYQQIGYASGIYGCIAKLFKGESGQLYAVTKANSALYIF